MIVMVPSQLLSARLEQRNDTMFRTDLKSELVIHIDVWVKNVFLEQ